ncbi:MAG TPA: fatty acid desaturase [Myxococcota bacterium]|nr:fatty acid desaturase [Myxococcota bacterium]
MAFPFLLDWVESRSADERRPPSPAAAGGLLDGLVYALFVLHWANLLLAARLVAGAGWASVQSPAALVLVVVSGSLSGAVAVLFQVVNYFEHWGIERNGELGAIHSWDTTNRSTLFSMLGQARHADHHLHPARPFHLLEHVDESPKLPRGYGGVIWLALVRNGEFRRLMAEALRRREAP